MLHKTNAINNIEGIMSIQAQILIHLHGKINLLRDMAVPAKLRKFFIICRKAA